MLSRSELILDLQRTLLDSLKYSNWKMLDSLIRLSGIQITIYPKSFSNRKTQFAQFEGIFKNFKTHIASFFETLF